MEAVGYCYPDQVHFRGLIFPNNHTVIVAQNINLIDPNFLGFLNVSITDFGALIKHVWALFFLTI